MESRDPVYNVFPLVRGDWVFWMLSDRLKNEDITTVAFGGQFSLSGGGCCMSGEMFLVDQMTLALVNIKVSADQFVVD